MRNTLELTAVLALIALIIFTWTSLQGSNPLPARVPTHFGASGQPDAWGRPSSLWMLPIVAVGLYLLITVVSFFPGSFNFPVRQTPANRPRLEKLALRMIAFLKAELVCLFLMLQLWIVQSVRSGHSGLPPWLVPLALVVIFGTIAAHIIAIVHTAH
jgi:uncharacterized membrane protein